MLKTTLLIAVTAATLAFGSSAGFAQTSPIPITRSGDGEVDAPQASRAQECL